MLNLLPPQLYKVKEYNTEMAAVSQHVCMEYKVIMHIGKLEVGE